MFEEGKVNGRNQSDFSRPGKSRSLKAYFKLFLMRYSNNSVVLDHTISTLSQITQSRTNWEVHFSRPSSAIQHAILVSQSSCSNGA
jgi:hypothetical protein